MSAKSRVSIKKQASAGATPPSIVARLAEIRKRHQASTAGEWQAEYWDDGDELGHVRTPTYCLSIPGDEEPLVMSEEDVAFVVAAHETDIPWLLDQIAEMLAAPCKTCEGITAAWISACEEAERQKLRADNAERALALAQNA